MLASIARTNARAINVAKRNIAVGQQIPEVSAGLKKIVGDEVTDATTADLFKGKRVVVFGLPGAFTPVCSASHLPGFVAKADEVKAKGIDDILCLTVNDFFVTKVGTAVSLLADGNGELTKALDMEEDMSAHGMAIRSNRYSMVVDDGKVTILNAEPNSGTFKISDVDSLLKQL